MSEEVQEVDARGQISVPLGGENYILRPSLDAIVAIEKALDMSLHGITEKSIQSRLSLDEMAIIVTEMMKAYGKANPGDPLKTSYIGANAAKVKTLIFEAGPARINPRLVPLLMGALTGGYTPEGELKAAE